MYEDIRLIALDLDRTTLAEDKSLSPGNRRAILDALAAGIHVVIASGRSFASLPEVMLKLPGIEYAITSNGAAIYRTREGRRCHEWLLTPDSVEQILRAVPPELSLECFVDGVPYAWRPYVENPAAHGAHPGAVNYIQSTRHPVEDIRGFMRENIRRLDSVDVVVNGEEEKARVRALLSDAVRDVYITSSVPQLIEISHRDAGKRSALRWLADRLGLEARQVAAFGDAENDRDMLAYAGLGVAMGNASDEVKAAADAVTLDFREDGVGYYIRKILGTQM